MIAPRSMMVAAVQVVSGQQVASQEAVAELISTDQRLVAELMIPSSSIGLVSSGQPVTFRYDAFSYRKFGSAAGRIISVSMVPASPSPIPATTASASEPMYRALVQLNRDTVYAYGKDIPLRPGQTLHATIIIDHLSVLEWLFDSFYAQRAKV
jgi:membrane fusion protein